MGGDMRTRGARGPSTDLPTRTVSEVQRTGMWTRTAMGKETRIDTKAEHVNDRDPVPVRALRGEAPAMPATPWILRPQGRGSRIVAAKILIQ